MVSGTAERGPRGGAVRQRRPPGGVWRMAAVVLCMVRAIGVATAGSPKSCVVPGPKVYVVADLCGILEQGGVRVSLDPSAAVKRAFVSGGTFKAADLLAAVAAATGLELHGSGVTYRLAPRGAGSQGVPPIPEDMLERMSPFLANVSARIDLKPLGCPFSAERFRGAEDIAFDRLGPAEQRFVAQSALQFRDGFRSKLTADDPSIADDAGAELRGTLARLAHARVRLGRSLLLVLVSDAPSGKRQREGGWPFLVMSVQVHDGSAADGY